MNCLAKCIKEDGHISRSDDLKIYIGANRRERGFWPDVVVATATTNMLTKCGENEYHLASRFSNYEVTYLVLQKQLTIMCFTEGLMEKSPHGYHACRHSCKIILVKKIFQNSPTKKMDLDIDLIYRCTRSMQSWRN